MFESTGIYYSQRAVKIALASLAWYIYVNFFFLAYKRQKHASRKYPDGSIHCTGVVLQNNDTLSYILSRKDTIKL